MKGKSLAWIEHVALAIFAISAVVLGLLLLASWAEHEDTKAELDKTKTALEKVQKGLDQAESILEEKNEEIERQDEEILNLSSTVQNKTAEIGYLKGKLGEAEEELERTRNILSEAKEEIDEIREEAEDMEEQITQSIQWFTDNAALPGIFKTERLLGIIERRCEESGDLRLACISHLMEQELDITYRTDVGEDQLYSIEEIIERKGGDCEDFSLFFKATVERLKTNGNDFDLEAWAPGGGRYDIYEDDELVWYYDNAHGVNIGNVQKLNAYPVCYYYGYNASYLLGHCVVMFTEKSIRSPDDITTENLMDAKFVEPQNGEYVGKMGEKFSVCAEDCELEPYTIAFIITNDDLYQFNEGEWNYYHGNKERIEELIEQLEGIRLE